MAGWAAAWRCPTPVVRGGDGDDLVQSIRSAAIAVRYGSSRRERSVSQTAGGYGARRARRACSWPRRCRSLLLAQSSTSCSMIRFCSSEQVSIISFLTDTEWTPVFENPKFGIMTLVSGTLMTTFIGLLVAVPAGTILSIYLSEFARPRDARGDQADSRAPRRRADRRVRLFRAVLPDADFSDCSFRNSEASIFSSRASSSGS